jgi:IS5 family transposase
MVTLKVVTGTIINAPCWTKNANKARDAEMHQTRRDNQWHFGMKAHFGVDSRTKFIHSAVFTPANVPTARYCRFCCTGKRPACGVIRHQAYCGQKGIIRQNASKASDLHRWSLRSKAGCGPSAPA